MAERKHEETNKPEKEQEAAEIEKFITNNSNGNGINPNPVESGNSPYWSKGAERKRAVQS